MPHNKRAVALGFFDGIHIGHAALLKRLVAVCNEREMIPTVISFDTMPQNFINKQTIPLINSNEDRIRLIAENFRVQDVFLLPFDEKMQAIRWADFSDMLINKYNAGHVIAGANFRFGKNAEGNSNLLLQKCCENNIGCDIIADVMLNNTVVSSTYIRELLLKGDIGRANAFLGHPHIFTGIVAKGKQFGSKIGAPTLNLNPAADVLVPKHGVYATKVYPADDANICFENEDEKKCTHLHTRRLTDCNGRIAVTNIGMRPTVNETETVTIETHIPGYKKDLYGHKVCIEFYKYLRPEIKFGSPDELKTQIEKDCESVTAFFSPE